MRTIYSSLSQRFVSVRAYGTAFSATAVTLQYGGQGRGNGPRSGGGGGYGNRQQGFDSRQQGYGNRDQRGYENRQHGYGNREQRGYDNRDQRGYDNRQQGYGNRQQGYGDRSRNYDNREQRGYGNRDQRGYDDRPQRGFNSRPPRGGGGDFGDRGGRPPRRAAEDYFQENVESLLKMKQAMKQAKHAKERMEITRDARRLVRRIRFDPSTQDERSITILLNCGGTFRCTASGALEAASQWMRTNLRGVSPHNVALYTNALGLIHFENAAAVLRDEIAPILRSVAPEMTPVEVVMVLQAFQRLFVTEQDELKDELLLQLEPCIPTMPVPQLSTLATVLTRHKLRERNKEKHQQIAQEVMQRAMASVETMHSKEAIVFLDAAARLGATEEDICRLIARATDTANFHTDEQIGDILGAVGEIQKAHPTPSLELTTAIAKLQKVLLTRLEKVASLVGFGTARIIFEGAAAAHMELPDAIVQTMCEHLIVSLSFRAQRFRLVSQLLLALSQQKLPSPELLHVLAKYTVGERPPRPDGSPVLTRHNEDGEEEGEDMESVRAAAREALYGRLFHRFVVMRLALEDAYAKNGVEPQEALRRTLPENLLRHIADASPRSCITAAWSILTADVGCPCRNTVNDTAILDAILQDLKTNPDKYKQNLSSRFVEKFLEKTSTNPKAAEFAKAMQRTIA